MCRRLVLQLLLFFLFIAPVPAAPWMDYSQLPEPGLIRKTTPLDIIEARKSIGYPDELARRPEMVMREKFPIVIIDAGFEGLRDFLKAHPEKAAHVKSFVSFYKEEKTTRVRHGFDVYRTALMDSPDADYHLFQVDLSDPASFERALKHMVKHHLYQANYSAGLALFAGPYQYKNSTFHDWLEKYQVFLFQSIGNERDQAHYFQYWDTNGNKILEFIPKQNGIEDRQREINIFKVKKGRPVSISLRWNPDLKADFEGRIELRAISSKNMVIASSPPAKGSGVSIAFTPEADQVLALQVLDHGIINPEGKDLCLYFAKGMARSAKYRNGFGISTLKPLKESPFLISVGSFARGEDGKFVPSNFSSYTQTVDGRLLPHILGPGQLKIGQETILGTSFSSPFISSFFTKFSGFNTKNLVESISSKEKFSPGVKPVEMGRWGIPDVMRLGKSDCLFGDRIEDLATRTEAGNLVVAFKLSRRCMEKMKYRLAMTFKVATVENEIQRSVPARGKDGKALVCYSDAKQSQTRDINREAFTLKMPLKDIQDAYGGNWARPAFSIQTMNTGNEPLPLKLPTPIRQLKFPLNTDSEKGLEGEALFKRAGEYMNRGAFGEALRLMNQGLAADPDLSWADAPKRETIIQAKAFCLIFTNQPARALAFMEAKEPALSRPSLTFYPMMAGLEYQEKNFQKAMKTVAAGYKKSMVHPDLAVLEYLSARQLKAPIPQPPAFKKPGDKVLYQNIKDFLEGKMDANAFYRATAKLPGTSYPDTPAGRGKRQAMINFIGFERVGAKSQHAKGQLQQAVNTKVIYSPWVVMARYQLGKLK